MVNITAIDSIITYSAAGQVIVKVVVAVLILLVGFILGKFVSKLVTKILHELELNKTIAKITKSQANLEQGIGLFFAYLIYFITFVVFLNQLGLTTTILYILVGAVIILIILSVLIGFKDFIPNAFAGFFFFKKGNLKVGDTIKFKGVKGKIAKIGLTEIVVETKNRELVYVPTSALSKTELVVLKKAKKK